MKKFISTATLALMPLSAFAQTYGQRGVTDLIQSLKEILASLVPILIAIAVLAFMYSVVMFIIKKDDPEKSATFKKQILWELFALVLLFAWFGFIKIIANTIGVDDAIGKDIQRGDLIQFRF